MSAIALGVAAGAAALGGAMDFRGSKKAKDAAWKQADLTYETRMEQIRRVEKHQEQVMGRGKAVSAASGVRMTAEASTTQYLDSMQDEFSRQLQWARDATQKEHRAIRKGQPGMGAAGASALAGAMNNFGRMYSMWGMG